MVKSLEKTSDEAIEINYDINKVKQFIDSLPFELTDAQKLVSMKYFVI